MMSVLISKPRQNTNKEWGVVKLIFLSVSDKEFRQSIKQYQPVGAPEPISSDSGQIENQSVKHSHR